MNDKIKTLKETIETLTRLINNPTFSQTQKEQARNVREQLKHELERINAKQRA